MCLYVHELLNVFVVFSGIKGAFGLVYGDGDQLKLSVDNAFPLLKTLGLSPQSESVVDLCREASIECKYTPPLSDHPID